MAAGVLYCRKCIILVDQKAVMSLTKLTKPLFDRCKYSSMSLLVHFDAIIKVIIPFSLSYFYGKLFFAQHLIILPKILIIYDHGHML